MARFGNNDFRDEYCDLIITMFEKGGTLADFCKKVGCGRRTVYNWIQRYPKGFGEAYAYARECAKVHRDNQALEWLAIDNSEGAVNYDVKAYLKSTQRRFQDMEKETPPPKILDKKPNPDLFKAAQRLVHETVTENLSADQAKVIGNLLKALLEVKEKEELAEQLEKVEAILAAGQATNNVPVNSPEPEFEEVDDNTAE